MNRLYNRSSYNIDGYLVTLSRIKNSNEGCPRFEAIITNLKDWGECNRPRLAAVFHFKGHYFSEAAEAALILNEYLKLINEA